MVWHATIGNGPTKVVILHGWFWDHRAFMPMFDGLDIVSHTYALVDIRGYGNSRQVAGEFTIGEVAAHYDLTFAAVSKHLQVLERAGLVRKKRKGRTQVVRGSPAALEVFVEDEGPGMPNTSNLFVPFFTTKQEGSGIGLVLSRQIAEAHGGTLTLENREPGPGCRARLRLPLGAA